MDNHRLVYATTAHKRFLPKQHAFSYSLVYTLLDLDDLHHTDSPLFSVNRRNLFWIREHDYLHRGQEEDLITKVKALEAKWQLPTPSRRLLLTFPNLIIKSFNPVSFFFNLDDQGKISSAIAFVSNTEGESHIYLVSDDSDGEWLKNTQDKTFYVSPFLENEGSYHFKIHRDISKININIDYKKQGKATFFANLVQTHAEPITTPSLIKAGLLFPMRISGAFLRILKQAAILKFVKGIQAAGRPTPQSPDTIRKVAPTMFQKKAVSLMKTVLKPFNIGGLTVKLPSEESFIIGNDAPENPIFEIKDYRFFNSLFLKGEIGFGESYVDGYWTTTDLIGVLDFFLLNKSSVQSKLGGSIFNKMKHKIGHAKRRNSIFNSKKNIQDHYDIGNDFYALFLDPSMMYSSALYQSPEDTLEQAQLNKLDQLFDMLRVNESHHVLEIGTGWGAAAIRLAQTFGCKVTTLTLSNEQYTAATEKINALGLSDKITVKLEDYRHHKGNYDRVISIEMMEAVGYEYLPTYFKCIDKFLNQDGLAVFQVITVPDYRYEKYRSRQDWIQKYIFPGGHLPSFSYIQKLLHQHSNLSVEAVQNIGPHYAKTLRDWKQKFTENLDAVQGLGFDERFIRMWTYYLTYCETGFKNRYINNLQFSITRPINKSLIKEDIK